MSDFVLNVAASLGGRAWLMRPAQEAKVAQLVEQHGLSPVMARILAARDVSAAEAATFLNPRLRDLLPDPFSMAGMDDAVQCVSAAIQAGAPIAICGDYDADGITASALLKKYLTQLGCDVKAYLPDRMRDGYGLNIAALDEIKQAGRNPVITVDCGAKDIKALTHAEQQKLDVVVLDHHPTDAPPPARAFVNPNGPSDQSGLGALTAVGVGFMFLVALNSRLREQGRQTFDLMNLLDLVALGTICDVAPLIGLNRAFVVRGLEMLARRGNIGLAALAEVAGLRGKPDVEAFSFLLGPRINAAGRVGHPDAALDLLTCDDPEKARELARQLNQLNRQRQAMEAKTLNEAVARLLAQDAQDAQELPEGIVVAAQGWHPGVIGIVAARLRERYDRPVAVIALDGDQGTGSARGAGSVNLGDIMAQAQEAGLLIRGGGHPQAAGFSIHPDQVAAFADFFASACAAHQSNEIATLEIDAVLDISSAKRSLYEDFQAAFPFGKGNPPPRILFTDARLMHLRASAAGHLRGLFQPATGGRSVEAVAFRQADTAFGAALQNHIGEVFHLAGHLRPAWRSAGSVEILLEDAVRSMALGVEAA